MKTLIVSAWRDRFDGDGRARALPSLSAIHLAALCPPEVEVQIVHEHVAPVDLSKMDADVVAISAMTGSAPRMYELADALRSMGRTVLLGGPHVSLLPAEALEHADAVAVGEADRTFPEMLADFQKGRLRRLYQEVDPLPLEGLPVPRYDLLEDKFLFRCYVQATRGCPHSCTFCTLKAITPGYRVRPVAEVIRDIEAADARTWLQRKFVWFWDDNLTGNHDYARELFSQLTPLKKWWWSQCSIDTANDRDLLRLAARSGCLAVFIGVETFEAENLLQVRKHQNKVERYKELIRAFHDVGIAVHAGLIIGMDHDSERSIRLIPEIVADFGIDLPFVNVLTPFPGTILAKEMADEGRLLGFGWERHNATAVTFEPRRMTAAELETAYWEIRRKLYSVPATFYRLLASVSHVSLPTFGLNSYVSCRFMMENLLNPDGPWPDETLVAGSPEI